MYGMKTEADKKKDIKFMNANVWMWNRWKKGTSVKLFLFVFIFLMTCQSRLAAYAVHTNFKTRAIEPIIHNRKKKIAFVICRSCDYAKFRVEIMKPVNKRKINFLPPRRRKIESVSERGMSISFLITWLRAWL